MTDKICPFLSKVVRLPDGYKDLHELFEVYCLEDRCESWKAIDGTIGSPIYGCKLMYHD